MSFEFTPIGTIRSCYTDKFGIPRQPGLVQSATATLELDPPFNQPDALRGLGDFSHVWIVFVFHQSMQDQWKSTVRPPRLGGNERVGVFASRSNFRPNPIGMSVVELRGIMGTSLILAGGDFLDGTPVLDIKPYIPYADSVPNAHGGFAHTTPERINEVGFLPEAEQALRNMETSERPGLVQLVADMLSYDPRPAYLEKEEGRVRGTTVFGLEIKWMQDGEKITVFHVGT